MLEDGIVLPEGGICEVNFRYNNKMGVYTNLSSDIPMLYAIESLNNR